MEETGRNEHSREVTCPRSQRVSSCLSQTQNPACRQKKKKKASEEKWRWKVDQIKKKQNKTTKAYLRVTTLDARSRLKFRPNTYLQSDYPSQPFVDFYLEGVCDKQCS